MYHVHTVYIHVHTVYIHVHTCSFPVAFSHFRVYTSLSTVYRWSNTVYTLPDTVYMFLKKWHRKASTSDPLTIPAIYIAHIPICHVYTKLPFYAQ